MTSSAKDINEEILKQVRKEVLEWAVETATRWLDEAFPPGSFDHLPLFTEEEEAQMASKELKMTMEVNELLDECQKEIREEKKDRAKEILKGRLREIDSAERALKRMRKQLTDLLEKEVDEIL